MSSTIYVKINTKAQKKNERRSIEITTKLQFMHAGRAVAIVE